MNDCTCPLRPWEACGRPYRVPMAAGCDVEDARLYHDDLAAMAVPDLDIERHRVIDALVRGGYLVLEHEWLAARLVAIAAERSRRAPQIRSASRPRAAADEWQGRRSFETMNGHASEWGNG